MYSYLNTTLKSEYMNDGIYVMSKYVNMCKCLLNRGAGSSLPVAEVLQ